MATLVRMMSASDILIQSANAKRERKMDHSEMAHSRRRAEVHRGVGGLFNVKNQGQMRHLQT